MKKLFEIIRSEASASGVLPFARFMELALYCPVHGYYETQKDNIGQRGDFYTSVSTGELFGQLLAFQFAEWLEQLRIADCGLRIVEAGAHDGKLAKDILSWLQLNRPKLFGQIEYLILETSPHRQEWQRKTLRNFPNVRWHNSQLSTLNSQLTGIIFSNELLDAMPVHRYGWDDRNKKWFEWGVAVEGDKFVWAKIQTPGARHQTPDENLPSFILHLPSSLLDVLPDNYTIETSPAAESWWREAAGMLAHGKLLTIDYGHTADEVFSPARTRGTLRAYHQHHVSDDLLANVGEQDLTAHVNFSAIQSAGEAAGLTTESFTTQPQFLTQILGAAMKDKTFGEWNPQCTRQFQTLTHPEHLGRAFRVLVQSR
ncbi:MAG: SAM-dependent methyltransferase [Verrucomicrobiales bacterium]|nr:SAM-dependent methyltransferase [Verrucomicrobiales bacterium]